MNNEVILPDSFNRKGSGLLAIVVGGIGDIVGSLILGIFTLIILSALFNSNGMSLEQISKYHTSIQSHSKFLLVFYSGGCVVPIVA